MLQLDGWTDRRGRPFLNIMVSFPKGIVFWQAVCMQCRDKGAKAYFNILARVIREIGEESVVGVVMDNAATCAAVGQTVEAEFNHIFSVSCTAHSIDLIFKQFGKIGWLDVVLKKAVELVKFFMNHTKVQKTSSQLLDLLKLSDGVSPTISKIYGRMDEVVESLGKKDCFTEVEKGEPEEIIMRRWNTMTSPLHCAAMFLDPEFRDSSLDKDPEVMDGFWTWLYSWAKPSAYRGLNEEVNCWIEGTGKFRSERALADMSKGQPARWWRKWCSDMPNLQRQAIRLLGQGSSASGCERNWSLFERIHTKPRNSLQVGVGKLSRLVYNRWNKHLLDNPEKKSDEKEEAKKKKPWRNGVGDLTPEQLYDEAKKRVEEWRAKLRRDREEGEDGKREEDDDDDDGGVENVATTNPIARRRASSSLLELERELNKDLLSLRKAIRPSLYLARLHLEESQCASKTVTHEHAEKYISARPEACAPNVKGPANRLRGRPRKVAQVQDAAVDVVAMVEDGEACEQGSEQDAAVEVAAKRPRGQPRKASPGEEMQVEATRPEAEGETSRKGSPEAEEREDSSTDESFESSGADSEDEPLAKKKRKD
ncbi:hypothetical protein CBR_g49984 [Chara braunii]|uniref:DUF659 domain-containing protein n=1 Tax=Chara braunii TaxID=69332 RepID=A0A388K555_CHABU|nr:hypothetical protein CBR_g49984 [Chara braunii]|eukprot:GBG65192.1 hypothetical protein CBR_g49984 [Chara braunii]